MPKIKPQRKHWWVGLGGTFDHFHEGHEAFLEFAAKQGENLMIGVTAQHLTTSKPYSQTIEPFRVRAKNVANWCKKYQVTHEIVQLFDLYGPTLEDRRIQALAVTEETVSGADTINHTRVAANMKELPVYICPMLPNELDQPLHADQIRSGTTSRSGIVYLQHLLQGLETTEEQRKQLAQPLGELIPSGGFTHPDSDKKAPFSPILVGDRTLLQAIDQNLPFSLAVTDGKIERAIITSEEQARIDSHISTKKARVWQTSNAAGEISADAVAEIQNVLANIRPKRNPSQNNSQHTNVLQVEGEEDLLTAALILGMPLFSTLYYGQPKKGLVKVVITEQIKEKVFKIVMPHA
jgi:pantetheine-phosphate adenylyltransferase